jgi:hypothetical protein
MPGTKAGHDEFETMDRKLDLILRSIAKRCVSKDDCSASWFETRAKDARSSP